MKTLLTTVSLLILITSLAAQRRISYSYVEIKKAQYDTCRKTAYLTGNANIKKQPGRLAIPLTGKPAKVFKDDNSDENFHEFAYLGEIKGTALSLVKRTDYNSEQFYLINSSTGQMDTLIGEPVFAENMIDFACINNPGTDEKQRIQICEVKNGSVRTRVFLAGKQATFLKAITCIKRNIIVLSDIEHKYWMLKFKIGNK